MAQPSLPAPDPASGGVFGEAMRLLGSLGRHLQALFALIGIESREAVSLYVRLAVMLIAGLIFAVFGYIFVLLFVAFLLALVFGISWFWIALGFAVLHLGVAFFCGLHIRNHLGSPVFKETSAEIRKDLDALSKYRP